MKAVLFDLDGTLFNSIADIVSALNVMLKSINLPPVSANGIEQCLGYGAKRLVEDTINVSANDIGERYRVGDKVTIPSATFTDNLDGLTSMIYVLTPEGWYDFVDGGSEYEFKLHGTYYIVYSAKDNDNNVTRKKIAIVVA